MQEVVNPVHSCDAPHPLEAGLADVLQRSGVAALFEFQFRTNAMRWPFGHAGLYGRPQAAMARLQDWLAAMGEHDCSQVRSRLAAAIVRRMPFAMVFHRTRQGAGQAQRRLSSRIVLQYDSRGRPVRMVGMTLCDDPAGPMDRRASDVPFRQARCEGEWQAGDARSTEPLVAMAHALRNSVGAIIAAVEVLNAGVGGPELSSRAMAIIERQTNALALKLAELPGPAAGTGGPAA